MATLRAVVEIEPWASEEMPWPIEKTEPLRWAVLDGSTSAATIGTVMARLARWCAPPEYGESDHRPTAVEALRWIAAADDLVISGGIRAADGEAAIHPGCCGDLEGWREWPDSWLGHPAPRIEHADDGSLTIGEDGQSQSSVKFAPGTLSERLAEVRDDLIAFLHATERWATDLCADAELAAAVSANIDRHVVITGPLPDA